MNRIVRYSFLIAAVGTACGGADIAEAPRHTAHVLGAVAVTDTAQALVPELLRVLVTDAGGHPVPGAAVRFIAAGRITPEGTAKVFVRLVQDGKSLADATVTTDAAGVASVPVRLGCGTGQAAIALEVDGTPQADFVRYTIRPGALHSVGVTPTDTAVLVGTVYSLGIGLADQCGNPVSATPSFSSGPGVSVDAAGRVTALAFSREQVTVSAGNRSATVSLSVVPNGRLAAFLSGSNAVITVFSTVGTNVQTFTVPNANGLGIFTWSPDGMNLIAPAVTVTPTILIRAKSISTINGSSSSILLDTSPEAGHEQTWPAQTRDGAWIYMTIAAPGPTGFQNIWRVRADGSGLAQITTVTARYFSTTISPDGGRIAFLKNLNLQVMDLGSGVILDIPGLGGDVVRWSPTGNQLVTRGTFGVFVVNADGTQSRRLAPQTTLQDNNVGWSPDGQWIVYRAGNQLLTLVQVSTGLTLPLPFSGLYREATWAPTPGTIVP